MTVTISISTARYEDSDNCLADVERDYCTAHGLDGWDLEPRFADDRNREEVLLTVPVSKAWANERWSAVNDAGDGYAPPDAEDVDAAVDALVEEGGTLIRRAEADDDVAVVLDASGSLIAIGDAHGAWACEIG